MQWGGGRYWYRGGVRWQGITAFVLGLGASVLCSNSDLYASPLMTGPFGRDGSELRGRHAGVRNALLASVLTMRDDGSVGTEADRQTRGQCPPEAALGHRADLPHAFHLGGRDRRRAFLIEIR
jgi:hypothetical protein